MGSGPSVLVDHGQEPQLTTIFGPIGQKVVRPNVVFVLRAMTHTAILAATGKTASAMLFSRDLHVLSLPKSVDSLVVYLPMTFHKQPMNAIGPVAWTLPRQTTHLTKQLGFIIRPARLVSLRTTRLIEHTARPTLRHFL